MTWKILLLLLAVCLQALSSPVQSTTGLVNPEQVITFSEAGLTTAVAVTDQFAGLGVKFSPNLYFGWFGPGCGNMLPNISGDCLSNFPATGPSAGLVNPFSIVFGQPVTGAAFALASDDSTTSFTARLNGQVVETFSAFTSATISQNYYGFSGITFDEIVVTSGVGLLIDNVQIGPSAVPEPASPILILLGVGGLLNLKRRLAARIG